MPGSLYIYDLMSNCTTVRKTDENGMVVESEKYIYNETNQLVSAETAVTRITAEEETETAVEMETVTAAAPATEISPMRRLTTARTRVGSCSLLTAR